MSKVRIRLPITAQSGHKKKPGVGYSCISKLISNANIGIVGYANRGVGGTITLSYVHVNELKDGYVHPSAYLKAHKRRRTLPYSTIGTSNFSNICADISSLDFFTT
jgi:hypothetical protein